MKVEIDSVSYRPAPYGGEFIVSKDGRLIGYVFMRGTPYAERFMIGDLVYAVGDSHGYCGGASPGERLRITEISDLAMDTDHHFVCISIRSGNKYWLKRAEIEKRNFA